MPPLQARKTQMHLSDVSKDTFPFDLVVLVAPFTPDNSLSRHLRDPMGLGKMALAIIIDHCATPGSILSFPTTTFAHGAIAGRR